MMREPERVPKLWRGGSDVGLSHSPRSLRSTQWLEREGGRLAYSDRGVGPLVVCVPGIGDLREEYRFLAPKLAAAGFRVVLFDLRGHGESSVGWRDLSAEAVGGDILALIHHLDQRRALVVGTSMAAAAALWAAAEEPEMILGLVLIGPSVRDVGSPVQRRLHRILFRVLLAWPWGPRVWLRYWASLFPSSKPADFAAYAAGLRANLTGPGHFRDMRSMMLAPSRRAIEVRLPQVHTPALIVMGTKNRDFKNPVAEARRVANQIGAGAELVDGAGRYPHVEFPERTAAAVVAFARRVVGQEHGSAASVASH